MSKRYKPDGDPMGMQRTMVEALMDARILDNAAKHGHELVVLEVVAEGDDGLAREAAAFNDSTRRNLERAYQQQSWTLLLFTLKTQLEAARNLGRGLGVGREES